MKQPNRHLLIALLGLIVVLGIAVLISLSTKIQERRSVPAAMANGAEIG